MFVDQTTLNLLCPEIVLTGIATFLYVAGAFTSHPRWFASFSIVTYALVLVGMSYAEIPLWQFLSDRQVTASGPLAVDYLGELIRGLAALVGLLFTLLLWPRADEKLTTERLGTLMLSVVGIMLAARANDLVLLFLGLELVSIPTYILLFLGRNDRPSVEATAKYFFLSILSSGLLLYGFSFLYGLGGSTSLSVIRQALSGEAGGSEMARNLTPIALVLIVAGLGFKIGTVPFHFYAPDVYQGTTNANAGLLAVFPKIAGIVALLRVVVIAMPNLAPYAWQMLILVSIATMTLGNVCALWQKNLRRLLAYSSIAHAGYMLIGLAVSLAAPRTGIGASGVGATIFYLAVYSFASIGIFAALTYLDSDVRSVNSTEDLAGLGTRSPIAAAVLTICLLSFMGIPIFAGFWGKYALFVSALNLATANTGHVSLWFILLAVFGAINAAIGAAYYLRVIAGMFFQAPRAESTSSDRLAPQIAMVIAAALVVLIGVFPGAPLQQTRQAADSVPNHQARSRTIVHSPPDDSRLTAQP